jgi:hypothetical protein
MIGFINTLYVHSELETTGNYSAVADLHTLQLAVTLALEFSVFTSRILTTDFITVSLSLQITNSFLPVILQLASRNSTLNSLTTPVLYCRTHFITIMRGPRRKHSLHYTIMFLYNLKIRNRMHSIKKDTAYIVDKVCLPRRCLKIDVLLSREFDCVYRIVA